MSQARYTTRGAVAVITLDNPPVNGLGYELRSGLVAGLDRAVADPSVKAVVITGAGKAFSGGADIKEFNSPRALAEPNLHTVIRVVEQCPKPVVAAIHTVCMGGGTELSLGCHYRVASPGAQIALPEVKLGLLPGAGGTQRLPRVVGVEAALNMIVSGTPVPSEKLAGTRLFDAIIDGDLLDGAVAFAEKVADVRPLPLVRDIPLKDPRAPGFLAFARNTVSAMAKDYPAPRKCVDAVEVAATKPFEEGLAWERAAFIELVQTPESRALRHAFFAERAASKIPDVPEDTPTRPVQSAAVIGAGTMGGGIAMNFANAGIPVTVLEVKEEALQKGLGVIRKNYEGTAKKGKITPAQVEERMALIRPTMDYAALGQADIVVEAVFEDMAVKEAVFRKLDEVMKPGAILATNTSTLDVDRIASFTRRPQDVIGTHFFSPANVMKLLENRARQADREGRAGHGHGALEEAQEDRRGLRRLRRVHRKPHAARLPEPVPVAPRRGRPAAAGGPGAREVRVRHGTVPGLRPGRQRHRLVHPQAPLRRAPRRAPPDHRRQGLRAGPLRAEDRLGLVPLRGRQARPHPRPGGGGDHRGRLEGNGHRPPQDLERGDRGALRLRAGERGARILEEGIALRASDVDMVYLTGYGFPVFRGGPMRYADEVGLYNVVRSMARYAALPHADPAFWKPAALLARLAAEGKSFT